MFSKSLFQPKYRMLENVFKTLSDVGISYFAYSENDELPPPNEIGHNYIMLFDDVACERQDNIRIYILL